MACGQPLPGHEIRIVDEAGYELGERQEGRLEFRGPSTTRGYFHNEAKTRELIHNGWIDSADRAYMAGGDVYITGRIKDIIIRAGRHLYPQEIEEAVAGIPGIRKGGVAVFGVTDRASGTERVVVLAETRETDPAQRAAMQARAQEVTADIAGTPPDEVILAPPSTVPKTSSGKIRRSAAKELYASGRDRPDATFSVVAACAPRTFRGRSAGQAIGAVGARSALRRLVVGGSRRRVSVGIVCCSRSAAPRLAMGCRQMDRPRHTGGNGGFGDDHRNRAHSQPKSDARLQSLKLYGRARVGGDPARRACRRSQEGIVRDNS